ncbi:MAG: hydrolase 1, exosortase A system-associated [Burkholderiaceae bacterium]|nr:hydrolase 1, exosortase A system-associated [Flavobacteriales bacterium]MCB1997206.1 hydrolase 1, exosortase A system-associated [Rhodoferax sp.]MCP5286906.1 hydrolase 1, exosortase A system-associated [Burkholderiaceae bacterium]
MTATAFAETVWCFDCQGERLLGVLAAPGAVVAGVPPDLGVVIVVGGPQVRAGSHRQFVQLARHLAGRGLPVLRFDARGMGDSSGPLQPFEAQTPDIGAAIDALLHARPSVRRVALWGLCDGASAALLYLDETADPRVAALCLANPWVRSAESLARTQVKHYYRQRLMQADFWRKLLRGGVGSAAWRGLVGSLRMARKAPGPANVGFQGRMARAWQGFGGPILLLLSGQDYTAREFLDVAAADPTWHGALARTEVTRVDLAEADHTFSDNATARHAEQCTAQWLCVDQPSLQEPA